MAFCQNCGSQLNEGAAFCAVCGAQQGYAAPAQGYAAPAQGYAAPAQGYAAPAQGYAAPAPGYAAPAQGYAAPAPGYAAPAPGYAAPAPGYAAPAPGYAAPAPAQRMVTIERKGVFGTDPMGVYIDDGEYAIVRQGETKTFPIPAGMHRLQIRATSHAIGKGGLTVGQGNKNSYSSDVIYIQETDGNLHFVASMNMFGKISIKAQ